MASELQPTEIRVAKDRHTLTVTFGNGTSFAFPAEFLRVESPSAEVQGHSPSQRVTVPGKKDVGIMKVEPVGNYAIRITFDDMHSTGIYSWPYLAELARDHDSLWARYLEEIEEKGLSREAFPVRPAPAKTAH